ncbi:MAG: ParB/RepB/Spo0J family partition protein [Candidatus Liptonbacteria bacterium]|nr:ParB/RepB/Spo0J family partition protein [Candidatus Liptonbacteria bacterium]
MLGKGLESLIPSSRSKPSSGAEAPPRTSKSSEAVFQIEVEKIKPNPHQPRKDFEKGGLEDLAHSIREVGFLQPLVVSKIERETEAGTEVEYHLIAGERRLLAARILGLERVPAIVRTINTEHERLQMAVIENLQRENLNPIEMARAFAKLQDEFSLTQREIATRLGKSRESIANSVRLLDLPVMIQEALIKNQITETHGRLLLAVTDAAAQERFFQDLIASRLTTRELKNRVRDPKWKKDTGEKDLPPELKDMEVKLSAALGAPVKISQSGETGKITITFYSPEELKNILEHLGGGEG